MKFHKGDEVKIVTGKDKGKTGKIDAVLPKVDRVLIAGMNTFKRHIKARTQNQKSEIITITKPMSVAKIAIICPKCKQQTRVGYQFENDKKIRICRKCGGNL